jgi:myosin-1
MGGDECDDEDSTSVVDSGTLEKIGALLGVDPEAIEKLFTTKPITVGTETMEKPLNSLQAMAARDSVAKALYENLFSWLVAKCNGLLAPAPRDQCVHAEAILQCCARSAL